MFCMDLRGKSYSFSVQRGLAFTNETDGVFCAVRNGTLNKRLRFVPEGLNNMKNNTIL